MKKNVYIPVEVKSRAFTAKLFLAKHFLDAGFGVVIGGHGNVRDLALKDSNGVYIEKDFFFLRSEAMKKMKEKGFLLYAYDEEGLFYLSKQSYIDMRTDSTTLSLCNKIFTWGPDQCDSLRESYDSFKDKFILAGNPRFDLITSGLVQQIYASEIEDIKQYGDYILVNSNFTAIGNPHNSAEQVVNIISAHGRGDNGKKHIDTWEEYFKSQSLVFGSLINAIAYLAENTDKKIIIRLHPAEDSEKWMSLEKYRNVIITSKYDANPWIICSKVVIHHSCTTGLEAFLLGKPVISYSPNDSLTSFLDELSIQAVNKEELCEKVFGILEHQNNIKVYNEVVNEHVYLDNNLQGVSNQIITQTVIDGCLQNSSESSVRYKKSFRAACLDCIYIFKSMLKGKTSKLIPSKFPHETVSMLKNRLKTLYGDEYHHYGIKHIGFNLFYLYKDIE